MQRCVSHFAPASSPTRPPTAAASLNHYAGAVRPFGYAKDYDAIMTVGGSGRQAEFALEYDRTAKSARKYRRIRREIEFETLVAHFVYLASNYHLLNFITQLFGSSRKLIHFGLLDDFRQQHLGMRVVDCTRTRSARLNDVLQIAAPEGARL